MYSEGELGIKIKYIEERIQKELGYKILVYSELLFLEKRRIKYEFHAGEY